MSANVNLAPLAKLQFNQNGVPLSGGLLFTYAAGTMNKQATYTDSTGVTPNTNPIVLDANGQCGCWMQQGVAYKMILSPATDTDPPTNPFWTVDNVFAINGQTGIANGTDIGVANAYAMSIIPAPTAITPGMLIGISGIVGSNTGASTFNLNGLGALPIQGPGAAAMQGGEFVAGGSAILQANAGATAWNLIWTSGAQPVAAAGQSGQAVNLGQFPSSFASSGYQKLPNGLIIQWGTVTGPASGSANTFYSTAFTWPIAFPNAILAVSGSLSAGLTASAFVNVDFESRTLTGANFIYATGAAFSSAPQITYIAIGR